MPQVETRVLGGIPVTIEAEIAPSDKSVGIFSCYVDDWRIVAVNGRTCKKSPKWLYDRIEARKGEEDRIVEDIANKLEI